MTVGERIKQRRISLGLSVDAVAEAVGVNRATVYRYESDEIKGMGTDTLIPLAKILRTTPAWLMGWDDEGSPVPKIRSMDLSPLEADLIDSCRQLNDDGCKKVLDYTEDLAASGKYRK